MQDEDILRYVQLAAQLEGMTLDDERQRAVTAHFKRTMAMAQLQDTAGLQVEDEPAEVYCPAPFPIVPPHEGAA